MLQEARKQEREWGHDDASWNPEEDEEEEGDKGGGEPEAAEEDDTEDEDANTAGSAGSIYILQHVLLVCLCLGDAFSRAASEKRAEQAKITGRRALVSPRAALIFALALVCPRSGPSTHANQGGRVADSGELRGTVPRQSRPQSALVSSLALLLLSLKPEISDLTLLCSLAVE